LASAGAALKTARRVKAPCVSRIGIVATTLSAVTLSCMQPIENRGSPEPLPPSTATKTVSTTPRPAEPATCEEAEATVRRALEQRDEVTLNHATSSRERLCRDATESAR
jgi:hypothetical protein